MIGEALLDLFRLKYDFAGDLIPAVIQCRQESFLIDQDSPDLIDPPRDQVFIPDGINKFHAFPGADLVGLL